MAYAFYLLGSAGISTSSRYDLVQLEEGWTVSRGEERHTPPQLSRASIGIMNKGDTVTLQTTLPTKGVVPACIEFRSILSTVDVYVDGDQVYSYGHDLAKQNKMLPKYIHFVPVPDDYQGKKIEIVMVAQEDNAFSGISPILFGNYYDISRNLIQNNRIALVIGIFLATFGFILFVQSPFLIFSKRKDFSICLEGLLSIFMGVYILCYNDIMWYLSDRPEFCTFIEYFSLFCLPATILGFITSANQVSAKKLVTAFSILDIAFPIITALLHLLDVVHICHFVQHLHIIVLFEGVTVITALVIHFIRNAKADDDFVSKNYSTYMLILGLILFMGCSVVDIIKFNVMKFGEIGEATARINFMTVGAFIFIICLILNYFFHSIEYIREVSVQQRLEGLAYTDSLTGLANRAKCELSLANLKDDYTIVSIDLDYLKYTNDNYGHAEGDKLLSGFANILSESFSDAQVVGRMGGDEFIAILPYIDEERCQQNIRTLQELMGQKSSSDGPVRYSASYGYAPSNDQKLGPNPTAQNVYLLADARMYSMKKKHHNQSLGRLYDDLLSIMTDKSKGGKINE
jgi:diguanylate cyclase (GGDEF)-like protein